MNQRELKYWALLKWRYIVQNNGSEIRLLNVYPYLVNFKFRCSYCNIYNNYKCYTCPVNVNNQNCLHNKHPYTTWLWYNNKENAQAVLDIIKAIKVDRTELFYKTKELMIT
jgi:hypothetical protein